MPLPDFLQFTPVSAKGRSRPWEPRRQVEFIAALNHAREGRRAGPDESGD
jgi:hypothetical protein